jgi:hypothetical protein
MASGIDCDATLLRRSPIAAQNSITVLARHVQSSVNTRRRPAQITSA